MLVAQQDIDRYIQRHELEGDEVLKIRRVSMDDKRNGTKGVIADELLDIFLWCSNMPNRTDIFAECVCSGILPGTKILEVGCGPRPVLARKLMDKGMEVVAIDPRLKYTTGNFRREYFALDYDVSPYDLVIGLEPCEAIEPIIRVCIREKKPFIVAPCGQPHSRLDGKKDTSSLVWWNYLRNIHPDIELNYVSFAGGYVIPVMSLYTKIKIPV